MRSRHGFCLSVVFPLPLMDSQGKGIAAGAGKRVYGWTTPEQSVGCVAESRKLFLVKGRSPAYGLRRRWREEIIIPCVAVCGQFAGSFVPNCITRRSVRRLALFPDRRGLVLHVSFNTQRIHVRVINSRFNSPFVLICSPGASGKSQKAVRIDRQDRNES